MRAHTYCKNNADMTTSLCVRWNVSFVLRGGATSGPGIEIPPFKRGTKNRKSHTREHSC